MKVRNRILAAFLVVGLMFGATAASAVTFYQSGTYVKPNGSAGIQPKNCGNKKVYMRQYSFDFAWTDSTGNLNMTARNAQSGVTHIKSWNNAEFDEVVYTWKTGLNSTNGMVFAWSGLSTTLSSAQITTGCY